MKPSGLSDRVRRLLLPNSLRYQLLVRSLLIIAVLLLLIGVFQYWLMRNFVYHNQAETMRAQIPSLPRDWIVSPEDMSDYRESFPFPNRGGERRPVLLLSDSSLAFVDSAGNFTDISGESGNRNVSPQLPAAEYARLLDEAHKMDADDYLVVEDPSGLDQLLVFRALGPPDNPLGLLQLGTDVGRLRDVLLRQLLIFVGLSGLALLSALFVSLPVIRRTLDPLSRMIAAVERTNAGNLSERLPERHNQQEIDRLSVAFNRMLARLDRSFQAEVEAKEQMRRFIADASHELRTPLTSISGFLEVLLRGAAGNKEQLYSALTSMQGESRRINKLVEDLLLLAKFDRAPELWLTDTDLNRLLEEMEPQLRMLAGARSLQFDRRDAVRGQFDSDKLKQVMLNLFQNAFQHTDPESGVVRLTLKLAEDGAAAELSVRDNGPGIDAVHLPHLFDRFYRSESSRTRRSGGAGLGLSISKSIVEAHGGTIRVESRPGEGSEFIIRLPIRTA